MTTTAVRGLLAAATSAVVLAVTAAPAAALGPAPIEGVCYGEQLKPGQLCFYNPLYLDFELGNHILHVGDTVTGSFTWHLPKFGLGNATGNPILGGRGLKLVGCHGDGVRKVKGPDVLGTVSGTEGRASCTWKAVRDTGGWVTDLGFDLSVPGSNDYVDGDFYAVIGKDPIVEGEILTEKPSKKDGPGPGIQGARVTVDGPQSKTVTTNQNGYYFADLKKPGRYKVTPKLPKGARDPDAKRPVTPPSRTVKVARGDTARADFTAKDSLTVELKVDKRSVPADGFSTATVTLTAERYGKPYTGPISVRPFGASWPGYPDPEQVPVRATVCLANSRIWPDGKRTLTTTGAPVTRNPGADGKLTFLVALGTDPGPFKLVAWAETPTGGLTTTDVGNASDEVTIDVTKLDGGVGAAKLARNDAIQGGDIGNLARLMAAKAGLSLAPDAVSLARQLGEFARREPLLKGLVFSPVHGQGYSGVAVWDSGQKPRVTPAGQITDKTIPLVMTPGDLTGDWTANLAAGIPALPTLADWSTGHVPAPPIVPDGKQYWRLSGQANGTAELLDTPHYSSWGFPYAPFEGFDCTY